MDAEYFAQRIMCTREDKKECLPVIRQLLDLAYASQNYGLLVMEAMVQDRVRYPDAFLRKAVGLTSEVADPEKIGKVLYNLIISSKYVAKSHFLKDVLITETMLAVSKREDLDYVFAHLIPSYFGVEYADKAEEVYRNYKRERAIREQELEQQEQAGKEAQESQEEQASQPNQE